MPAGRRRNATEQTKRVPQRAPKGTGVLAHTCVVAASALSGARPVRGRLLLARVPTVTPPRLLRVRVLVVLVSHGVSRSVAGPELARVVVGAGGEQVAQRMPVQVPYVAVMGLGHAPDRFRYARKPKVHRPVATAAGKHVVEDGMPLDRCVWGGKASGDTVSYQRRKAWLGTIGATGRRSTNPHGRATDRRPLARGRERFEGSSWLAGRTFLSGQRRGVV